jgi:hypothetical protein
MGLGRGDESSKGGEWTFVYGLAGRSGEPDRNKSVITEIDRPRRLAYRSSMFVGE